MSKETRININPTAAKYHLLDIPSKERETFPPLLEEFKVGGMVAKISATKTGQKAGDPKAGTRIRARGLAKWFRDNNVEAGDEVVLTKTNGKSWSLALSKGTGRPPRQPKAKAGKPAQSKSRKSKKSEAIESSEAGESRAVEIQESWKARKAAVKRQKKRFDEDSAVSYVAGQLEVDEAAVREAIGALEE